jgi:hypothetical protein
MEELWLLDYIYGYQPSHMLVGHEKDCNVLILSQSVLVSRGQYEFLVVKLQC